MRPMLVLLGTVLVLAGRAEAQPKESGNGCHELSEKVTALISQYKELRERRRQLPDGSYDKDLRDHGGRLHRVLSSLGTALGHPPFTRRIIVGCVGEPDAVRNDREMARYLGIYESERRKAGREPKAKRNREYLVYHWRGGHDFLFFINEDGLIVDHGWWFAYE